VTTLQKLVLVFAAWAALSIVVAVLLGHFLALSTSVTNEEGSMSYEQRNLEAMRKTVLQELEQAIWLLHGATPHEAGDLLALTGTIHALTQAARNLEVLTRPETARERAEGTDT
jgi:hypothetical protein